MSEDQMTPEKATESMEIDAGPESGLSPDRDAQDAREARYAAAIMGGADREAILRVRNPGEVVNAYRDAESVMQVADAELAPLRARVAELEAEVERQAVLLRAVKDSHLDPARAILQADTLAGAAIIRAHVAEAALARVKALADEWEGWGTGVVAAAHAVKELRAALASSAPAVSDGEGATSEVAILSGVVLSAAGGIAATAAAASEQANVAKSLAAECQPRPQSDYDRARHAVAELRTKAGFVLGDVIATLVLDSGVVVPPSPVVAPSATDEGGA